MKRILALFSVLITLAACTAGGWVAARPSLAQFVVPHATDIQLTTLGWNEWQLSYRAPGAPTTWFTDVGQMLKARHWSSLDQVAYAPFNRTYSRVVSFGYCELWEWAYLTFDPFRPASAQIKVRRVLSILWWRGWRE